MDFILVYPPFGVESLGYLVKCREQGGAIVVYELCVVPLLHVIANEYDVRELYISKVFVDEGVTMKRMRPAPQGRGSI